MDTILKNEIASAARDYLMPLFTGVLLNQDDTLLAKGGGKGLAIYDDIERDAFAYSVINKRKSAVVSYPWEVEPPTNALRDRKAAELVKAQLTAINFDKLTHDLLDATLKGFSVSEVMWANDGNHIYVDKIISRNQRRFVFDDKAQLRLLTRHNMHTGEALPDRKFIVHSVGAKDGSPYGLGLGAKLFWPTYFKRQNLTFWLTFADKFGSPTVVGKYPSGTPQTDQDDLLDALRAVAQESAITVPEGMMLEMLEAQRSGAGDFYERMCRYMDEQISIAVLSETMTTQAKAAGLGSSQSDVHNDVRMELARADADLLTGTLQQTLVKWIVELNMPGANIPRVWRKIEKQQDLNLRAERDIKIQGLGFKPTLDYITNVYGEGWEIANIASLDNPVDDNVSPAQFADQVDLPSPTQSIEDDLSDALRYEEEAVINSLGKLVNNATSFAELQDALLKHLKGFNPEKMVHVMSAAFALAELKGMEDVRNESDVA